MMSGKFIGEEVKGGKGLHFWKGENKMVIGVYNIGAHNTINEK
jgi:hypothetical protein